jgi:hypothetical protein
MLKIIEKKLPVTVSPLEEKASSAKTVHGWEIRKKREYRAEKSRELKELEVIMRKIDICSG